MSTTEGTKMKNAMSDTPVLDAIMANDEDIRARYRQLVADEKRAAAQADAVCSWCGKHVPATDTKWQSIYIGPVHGVCISDIWSYTD